MLSLVSLGMSCQTAHQLALFASNNTDKVQFIKGPFDWLICPPTSASNWLDSGLADFNRNELTIKNGHVWWERYQLWFWHGFYERIGEDRSINVEETILREQEKLIYQRSVFEAIDPDHTLFFFSNSQNNLATAVFDKGEEEHFHLDAEPAQGLQTSLDRYFGQSTRLHWITLPNRCAMDFTNNPNLHLLEPETSDWKGDENNWNSLLSKITGI